MISRLLSSVWSNVFHRGAIWLVLLGVWLGAAGVGRGAFYFVNDLSTTGDVYTTAIGNDANPGTNAAAPKLTVTNLLASVSLVAGDVVYIDTGVYSNYTVTITNSGVMGNPIIFQGSTNKPSGLSTVFRRNSLSSSAFNIAGRNHLEFNNLTIAGGGSGFEATGSTGLRLNSVMLISNTIALTRGQWVCNRSVFAYNQGLRDQSIGATFQFDHCVFWKNRLDEYARRNTTINLSNSVYSGGDLYADISGGFNVFWRVRLLNQNRAYLYEYGYNKNTYSDPLFVDPDNLNFFPMSTQGRFDLVTGLVVTDAVHSILIDYADPSADYADEPSPNGARRNAGLYGGTSLASRSITNGWLRALTFNDGGAVTGAVQKLEWNFGNYDGSSEVRLDYSTNFGISWSNISSDIAVSNFVYDWITTNLPSTSAIWRIVSASITGDVSISRQPFALGGARVAHYVNDGLTEGDIYTTAVGNETNNGFTASSPFRSLTNLLAKTVLGKHDIVYIDRGVYSNYTTVVASYGVIGEKLIFQGVSEWGATVFQRNAAQNVFRVLGNNIIFRNLSIERSINGGSAIYGEADGGFSSGIDFEQVLFRNNHTALDRGGFSLLNSVIVSSTNIFSSFGLGTYNFRNTVFWNFANIQNGSSPWSIRNSVIVGGNVNSLAQATNSDFNVFWSTTFPGFTSLDSVKRAYSANWANSSVLDPHFVDPTNGNFYPRSIAISGRYDVVTGLWTNDSVHSPLIDFGDTTSTAWTNEQSPNGGRLNIGAYGGTSYASRSRTNEWLQVLSLTDGGLIDAGTDRVYWNSGNLPSGTTVRIEFSFNSGFTWTTLATNIQATNSSYLISNTNFPSSNLGRWRVLLESNTNIVSENGVNFIFKNGPFFYYVNDAFTTGDVYCTAPGNNANPGTTPDAPMATLRAVVSNRTFIAGDIIYVDTGVYEDGLLTSIPVLFSGTNGSPVVIQGSTNTLAGGSIIRGPLTGPNDNGLSFDSTVRDVLVRDLVIQRRTTGISFNNNQRITLERVRVESNSVAGISASAVTDLRIQNSAIRANSQQGLSISSGDASIINSVVWMNGANAVSVTGGRVMITNSVLGARGVNARIFTTPTLTNIVANYNAYRVEQSASVASVGGIDRLLNTLSAWQIESGMDLMSLDVNPLFINPEAGDFRLPSAAIQGRYDPVLGWVTDAVSSPLIDAGDPSAAFGDEASPNGGRVNIGVFGNTPFASKTEPLPRLYVGNLNQGGLVRGTSTLHWVAAAIPSNETVAVDYSPDGGESWTSLATGVLAGAESFAWDTTIYPSTVAGLWRVTLASDPLITSQTTNFFGLRNQPLTYYVNDGSTNQAVFTSGPGAATNWVATTNRPLNSLATVFNRYDLEPGDRIFVDRGTYSVVGAPVVISAADSGAPTSGAVLVTGAMSCDGAGIPVTEFVGAGGINNSGFLMDDAQFVTVSNVLIRQSGAGVRASRTTGLRFDGLHVTGAATNGVILMASSNVVFEHSRFSGNALYGFASLTNVQTRLINSLFYGNTAGGVLVNAGSVGITNSIVMSSGAGTRLFVNQSGGRINSDFNNLLVENQADVALYDGRVHKFPVSWSEATTNDWRSLAHDPGFVDLTASNFHLRSAVGRWDLATCLVVTDEVSSVMMDSGHPGFDFNLEPDPHGGRINLGLYGNTPFASLSPTNARLLTLSMNRGGTVRGTNVVFYWQANPAASNLLVVVDVSLDNGLTWTNIGTNISAAAGSLVWDSTPVGSRPLVYWRVTSADGSVSSTNESAFTINNGSIPFYVNDAYTPDDMYALASGSSTNDGLSPFTPVDDVRLIFSRYQPGPGDVIYIDTGHYTFSGASSLNANNSGHPTNPVTIKGSTNWVAGGTVINMNRGGPLLSIIQGTSYRVSDLVLTNGRQGFLVQQSTNVWIERVDYAGALNFPDAGIARVAGFLIEGSTNVILNRVSVQGVTNIAESAGILIKAPTSPAGNNHVQLLNSVLWSNRYGLRVLSASFVAVSNAIVDVAGAGAVGVQLGGGVTWRSDYNNFRVSPGAYLGQTALILSTNLPAISTIRLHENLSRWQEASEQDLNSLALDPGFVAPAQLDYSLASAAGRLTPTGYVVDAFTSPLIDAGNPVWDSGDEPEPNGGRLNMGLFGNTARASLSPTGTAVYIGSFNDGGVVSGTNVLLRWHAQGIITGLTATLRLSANGGGTWQNIVTGIPLNQLSYAWNTTVFTSGFGYVWGIVSEQNPSVAAQGERPFDIRNQAVDFYVNDVSLSGDVYTTATGSSANSGLSPGDPKSSLPEILDVYDLEPGDTVYIDTGSYAAHGNIRIGQFDSGSSNSPLRIVGSTNTAVGGTIFTGGGILVDGVNGLVLEHLSIQGTGTNGFHGVRLQSSANVRAERLRITGAGDGISMNDAVGVTFRNTLVSGSMTNGIGLPGPGVIRDVVFEQGVIWTNQGRAVASASSMSISNSVLAASGVGRFIYGGSSNSSFKANYNFYVLMNDARLASLTFPSETVPRQFATLTSWQQALGGDMHSQLGDPLLANPAGLDFHPLSSGGRWDPSITNWVTDAVTSPLVDAGAPGFPFADEPEPNGARINIGLFGNTGEASKSPASPDVVIGNLNDGGSVSGTNVLLHWIPRGAATGHLFRVEFSLDGGASWSSLASNVPPGTSSLVWDTTAYPSTVLALWRATSEEDPSISATNARAFAVRNGPVSFYVNDGDTAGDVYTTAVGSPSANGVTPGTPLDRIGTVLDWYDMEPGDVIFVDTGTYTQSNTIVVDQLDAGFTLLGSTNTVAGGTRLILDGPVTGIRLLDAPNTSLQHLRFAPVGTAIEVNSSPDTVLDGIYVEGGGTGISVANSPRTIIRNSAVRNTSTGVSISSASGTMLEHLVLWSNTVQAINMQNGSAILQNSVVGFITDGRTAIQLGSSASIVSDYNLFDIRPGGLVARQPISGFSIPTHWERVAVWSRETGNDLNSLSGNPGFAAADAGDFHPVSEAGRFDPATGTFVLDTNTSVLVDAGYVFSAFDRERFPNGRRVNIGMYGNTAEASRSPTNARVQVARFNDGGRAEGTSAFLSWRAAGAATGHFMRVEVSMDDGANWTTIQSNLVPGVEGIFWNTGTNASWLGRWRVVSQNDSSISATNAWRFTVRNAELSLYVNDASDVNDVYTSAAGQAGFTGTTPGDPRPDIQSLLDDYDLEPGDTIYVDTGTYTLTNAVTIGRYDAWNAFTNLAPLQAGGRSIRIKGSTHAFPGATVFIRSGSGVGFDLQTAYGVELQHLNILHGTPGSGNSVRLRDAAYSRLTWLQSARGSRGLDIDRSDGVELRHLLVQGHTSEGILAQGSTNILLRQSVLWSNQVAVSVRAGGHIRARNNALVVRNPNAVGWQRDDGPVPNNIGFLDANYTLISAPQGAYLAELIGTSYPGGRRQYDKMVNWQADTGLDSYSISTAPFFADPDAGDFHPQSPFGRFVTGSGYITNVGDGLSPLIDMGDPALPFATETSPNGQRSNAGLYGNSVQASLSPTNGRLQVVTFLDGGAGNGEISLRWIASGAASGHLVTLAYSADGGSTWTNIAMNVSASAQSYLWDSVPYGAAAAGRWRITSQQDPSVVSTNEQYFALRQGGSIPYYVNDASQAGDVYTTAPGHDDNDGFLPSTPKATLQALLDAIDLEPGDVVYVDTGTYLYPTNILFEAFDSGSTNAPVILRGSTNKVSGGSILSRTTTNGPVMTISGSESVVLEHLTLRGGSVGVQLSFSDRITLDDVALTANTQSGLSLSGSRQAVIRNSLIWSNGIQGVVIQGASTLDGLTPAEGLLVNNTIWGNRYAIRINQDASLALTNNLISADGQDARIYLLAPQNVSFSADFNAYWRLNQARLAERQVSGLPSVFFNRLIDWQGVYGHDAHALSHDPRVANAGSGDFHLRSEAGRFLVNGSVTNDPSGQHSPLIDTGDPGVPFDRETSPNGDRVNIGRYGNTPEASQSRTNGWLLALTLNDGGEIARTNVIRWTGGAWSTGATFRVEYAADGSTYNVVVASNLSVQVASLAWDVSAYPTVPAARWRVVNEQDPAVHSATESTFAVKNQPLVIYVNDPFTDGDVYTTAPGHASNSGLSEDSPLSNPSDALNRFPLGPGDVVYIDTGYYVLAATNGMRLGLFGDTIKTGSQGDPLQIIGSTNHAVGGSRIHGPSVAPYGLRIANARYVTMYDLAFSGMSNGVWVTDSEHLVFTRVGATGNRVGFNLDQSEETSLTACPVWGNTREGVRVAGNRSKVAVRQGVIWENRIAGVDLVGGSMSVSNSIIGVLEGGAPAYVLASGVGLSGDFNMYWTGTNNVIAKPASGGDVITLRDWQTRRGMDHRSSRMDPLFAGPGAGDFHPMSDEGRYDPIADAFVPDDMHSWAIDAGAFGDDYSQESEPNGGRVNIGLYGNTGEASRSSTNPALLAVSLDDGGLATHPQDLYWLTRGLDSNATVRLEYTQNDGLGWSVVASNLPASPGVFTWNTSGLDSTPLGRWRVILEDDESVSDETETPFYVRNGPIYYFVNDTNTAGDVYTFAPGAEEHDGITVTSPALSVSAILDRYDLDGGDGIFIDTGFYESGNNIRILAADSGHATNRVFLQGSTNAMAGGSIFYRVPATNFSMGSVEAAFEVTGAQYLEFSDLIITGANAGVYVNNTTPGPGNHLFRNMEIKDGGFYGIRMVGSGTNMLERVLVHRMQGYGVHATNSAPLFIDSSVLWSNAMGGVSAGINALRMTNSMIHAYGDVDSSAVSLFGTNGTFFADYNAYHVEGVASYYTVNREPFGGLPQLMQARTQELHSICIDPRFADPGNGDFHLQSPTGRWDPVVQGFVTNDLVFSCLLDAGAPGASFANEPTPNGGRRNIGLYGDTAQASKSCTDPWIRVITAMAGGRVAGDIPLRWNYGNLNATNRVHLDYSVDGGASWLPITTNVAIDAGGYLWESMSYDPFRTPVARWRITVAGQTNLMDQTARNFALNGPFQFYVNDGSTAGDVFTTAIGDDENSGIFSNVPKATLRAILDTWDVDPYDEILLDTGTYMFGVDDLATVRLDSQGSSLFPVVIRGSTNGVVLDGTLITNATPALVTINAPYVVLEDVAVRSGLIVVGSSDVMVRRVGFAGGGVTLGGTGNTLEDYQLTNATLAVSGTNVIARRGRVNNGTVSISGRASTFRNAIVTGNSSPLVGVSGADNAIVNNTLVGRATAIRQSTPGTGTAVRNNIIVTDGSSGTVQVYDRQSGTLNADYNLIEVRNGAWYGPADGGLWEKLIYWQARTGQDINSIAADPLFADEAAGDFHLKSVAGRYEAGSWVTDGVHSPAIDTGDPGDAADQEPAPNGGRVNMGAYGGTDQASMGLTGPWLLARTMNDGGVIRGTNVLRWSSGNVSPTNRVTLEYSANGGTNWTTIASGVNAQDGSYTWNTTTATSSLDGAWRVVLEGDPGVWDAPGSLFALRNDVRQFYLNDADTGGDVYTTAPGSNAQDGRTPGTPKATLDHLLSVYDTEPGDTIYMDTGVYTSAVVQVIWSRGGTTNQPVTIQGSTNYAQGGTVLRRAARSGDGLGIDASFIDVNDLTIENAARGVIARTNRQVRLDQVELRGNDEGAVFAGGSLHRIVSSRVRSNVLGGVRVAGVSNMVMENISFVDNTPYSVDVSVPSNSVVVLQNNIFYHDVATSNSQFAIQGAAQTVSNAFIDYNVYYFGPLAASNTFIYTTNRLLETWQLGWRKDLRGAVTNPAFADVVSGDLHVRSVHGRWDPGAGTFVFTDTDTSWAVDRGNPYSSFDRETGPGESGNRVNIGAYGNTPFASRSATNSGVVLETGAEPLSLGDGDTPYLIRWWLRDVESVPTNLTYTVQFSGDGGVTWTNLQTGVSVFDEVYRWTNAPVFNTFKGKLRLQGEAPNSGYVTVNEDVIQNFFGSYEMMRVEPGAGDVMQVVWRGAWDEQYEVSASTNLMHTNGWSLLIITNLVRGGDTVFTDIGATGRVFRVYRVLWNNTNDFPVP